MAAIAVSPVKQADERGDDFTRAKLAPASSLLAAMVLQKADLDCEVVLVFLAILAVARVP